MSRLIIVISIIFLSVSTFVGYYFLNNPMDQKDSIQTQNESIPEPKREVSSTSPVSKNLNTRFSDLIVNVRDIYGEKGDVINFYAVNAGKVPSGKYESYDRILLVTKKYKENKLWDVEYQVFATRDYVDLITEFESGKYPIEMDVNFKSTNSIIIDSLPGAKTINIDENFSLLPNNLYNSFVNIEKESYVEYIEATSAPSYTFPGAVNYNEGISEREFDGKKILLGNNSTEIYVDNEGLLTSYSLNPKFKNGAESLKEGEAEVPGEIIFPTNLKDSIKFKKYNLAYKGAISFSSLIRLNIPESDMEFITDKFGPAIYQIKNKDNKEYSDIAVNKYKTRVGINEDEVKHDENIENGAIIFIKSPFGGFIPLFESEISRVMMGGGKPVIYLYPEKETKVNIKFDKQMQFANVVPNYQEAWEVLAKPNGKLVDLKKEITNCNDIKITKSTTYAKEACIKNEYPYLYWSGAVYNDFEFPKQKKGFVVEKENLEQFFEEKLSYIGLNENEIKDFNEFWIPELRSKNMNFYTISFIQNEELQHLFPMTVIPKPQSEIRIFMDWNGYNFKPTITEQRLQKFERNGFTMVEWGRNKK